MAPASKPPASAAVDPLDTILQAGHTGKPEPTVDPSEMLRRSLPGVLLVLNRHPDKTVTFGSAILVEGNLALTNRHVIEKSESLSVMFHDASRESHSGIASEGGGLRRYIFENEKALVSAEIVREDAALDLAVIRVKGDTSKYPRLPWRSEPAKVGERVYAIGHPAENAWTSTAGVVSNSHANSIQIDATLNPGNSGGPLIDTQGKVVGVSTLVAAGGNQGIGYARPILLAKAVVDGVSRSVALDLSTPEKAWASCAQAAEMASETQFDCWQVTNMEMVDDAGVERALIMLGHRAWSDTMHRVREPYREEMRKFKRRVTRAWLHNDSVELQAAAKDMRNGLQRLDLVGSLKKLPKAELSAMQTKMEAARRRLADYPKQFQEATEKRIGMKMGEMRPGADAVVAALRLGRRIDQVQQLDASHAWLAGSGVNSDGSVYRYSVFMVREQNQWRQITFPTSKDAATKPASFPPLMVDFDSQIGVMADGCLATWYGLVAAALAGK